LKCFKNNLIILLLYNSNFSDNFIIFKTHRRDICDEDPEEEEYREEEVRGSCDNWEERTGGGVPPFYSEAEVFLPERKEAVFRARILSWWRTL
jgi:hypothetical protein